MVKPTLLPMHAIHGGKTFLRTTAPPVVSRDHSHRVKFLWSTLYIVYSTTWWGWICPHSYCTMLNCFIVQTNNIYIDTHTWAYCKTWHRYILPYINNQQLGVNYFPTSSSKPILGVHHRDRWPGNAHKRWFN